MSLRLIATNISNLAPISDYRVKVSVGDTVLYHGFIYKFERNLGAADLIRRIADRMDQLTAAEEDGGK